MAAAQARQPVNIRVCSLTSGPYVELTLEALKESGVEIERPREAHFRVLPGQIEGGHRRVEGDFSSAAYPAAAALLTEGGVELVGLRKASLQGDRGFLEVLAEMGARVEWQGETVVVGGAGSLTAVDRDLSSMPDQVPTLAAVAPFARGTTRIRNVAHLRLKESDRIAAMARELGRLGVEVEEFEDGLAVAGNWADSQPPSDEVVVESHGDHRVAMSLALTGLRRPGVIVQDPEVVGKSYAAFWKDLERLLES